ncbi:VapE domain-containing protein [Paraburkholderia sp. J11-2]|uniref:VapE domain-containing protein n=1 Tax=Paraburkholderia sp. J11-2 TaxID=2805431 RepID=UPI002AB6B73E|nr:VapE domain-containing protein [Paraburkholderia sp. J11-2]
MATLEQIVQQLQAAGHPRLPDGHPIADGKPHRYGPKKKHWYSLHEVVRAGRVIGYRGAFGFWSGDDNGASPFEWSGDALSAEDLAATRARQEAVEREEERKRAEAARLASNRARTQWQEARDEGSSAYLEKKKITPEGVRFDDEGQVLVPMFQYADGFRLAGLQKITPNGAKRFNRGMEKRGAAFVLGDIGDDTQIAMIAEGYATGRSIRMATDEAVPLAVCFDAGGIFPVARYLRDAYPNLRLLICADDDWTLEQRVRDHLAEEYGYAGDIEVGGPAARIECRQTAYTVQVQRVADEYGLEHLELVIGNDAGPERRRRFENTGLKRAYEALAAVGNAGVTWPHFTARGERKLTDFNDLHCEEGLDIVKAQLEAALLRALSGDSVDAHAGEHADKVAPDPLYEQAAAIVCESGRASISLVQRHLRIGYNRAAILLEAMESAGMVSPASSSGVRRVIGPQGPAVTSADAAIGESRESPANGSYTWQMGLRRTDKGAVKPDLDNVIDILLNDEAWAGVLAYEQFSQRTMKLRPPPGEAGTTGEWTDDDDVQLTYWLGKTWSITPRREIVVDAVSAVARRHAYHVVRDYLGSLEHDGVSRLETWLVDYLGVEDSEYVRLAGQKWLIGAVARVMRPGCKMDNVLILEGAQGAGKSRTIATLFGQQWTTDANLSLSDANTPIVMRGKWAIELAELDSLSKAGTAEAKRWITTAVDTFRPPYGRRAIDVPRQCVVVGTVNFDTYLKDESGNRRFWPVKVAGTIDLARLKADRDQIWAEAYLAFCEWERANEEAGGEMPSPWQVTRDEAPLFEVEQAARYEGDVMESLIADFIQHRGRVTVEEILFDCLKLEISKATKNEQRRVGSAMKALDWVRKRETTGARRWYYVPPEPALKPVVVPPSSLRRSAEDDDAPL